MKILRTVHEPYAPLNFLRREGKSVGLIPTMGALHEGHLDLMRKSVASCDVSVATIFVNPLQFSANEDLSRYPKTLESDLESLDRCGIDYVFVPSVSELYPQGFSTYVQPPEIANRFEGEHRPTHYRGVCTVVLKLFQLIPTTVAFFGKKDFQQLRVIQRMVEDFNLPIRIEPCTTIREEDGLAMSSRNRYLTPEDRQRAIAINRALQTALEAFLAGDRDVAHLQTILRESLNEGHIDNIDYASIVDVETFEPIATIKEPAVALIAARVGATRLIDNIELG